MMKILKTAAWLLLIVGIALLASFNYAFRFTHPEYTETMLFLSCWKTNLWGVLSVLFGLFVISRPDSGR
jgi:hypothetical protein